MIGEYTNEGWEARLRPHGVGRFFPAAFLSVWLCGWLAGEGFALTILAMGVRSLLTGEPPRPGQAPLQVGPALAVGAFILVWLTIWTFGGVMAMRELLRLVWAEDRVIARGDGISVLRRLGPFRSRRDIPRHGLRWIDTAVHNAALVAETPVKTIEISKLGSRQDREEAAAMLRQWLGMSERTDPDAEPGALPEGWEETVLPEGGFALISDHRQRHAQARAVTVIALFAGGIAAFLAVQAATDPAVIPVLAMVATAAAGIGWGAWRLHHIRGEWVIGNGVVTLRRRTGSRTRDLFEGRSLELTVSRDSDGDEWYALEALTGAEPEPDAIVHRSSKTRHRIAHAIHDPSVPRRVGVWLAQRADVPFRDRSEPKAREEELRVLREQLEKSGRFGKMLAGLVDRAHERGRRRSA